MNHSRFEQASLVLTWGALGLLAYLVYLIVEPFLIPLGWATVLAVVTFPVHARLARRWGSGRSAAATTLMAAFVLIVPAVALTVVFVRQTLEIAASLQEAFADGRLAWVARVWEGIERRVPAASGVDLAAVGADGLRRTAAFLMSRSGSIVGNVAGFFVDLALALFATFFFLRDAGPIMNAIRRLLPMQISAREEMIERTRDLISVGVTSTVIVAGLQGLAGGLTFAALGIDGPVFWGVVMAFLCVLPFGAWVIWVPAAIQLAASGSVTRAVILAVVGVGVIGMIDNVVRPILLSGKADMNGLVIFISLVGGLSVFGLLGIVLGPILVATALVLVTTFVGESASDSAT